MLRQKNSLLQGRELLWETACILSLIIVALVCANQIHRLGYYADDFQFRYIQLDAPWPVLFESGRFAHAALSWMLYKIFDGHLHAHHLLTLFLHLMVCGQLVSWLGRLGLSPFPAAVAVLFFAVFPVFYEVLYWLNTYHYLVAANLFLLALRLFQNHLQTNQRSSLAMSWLCYFVACGCVELMWPLCACFPLLQRLLSPPTEQGFPENVRKSRPLNRKSLSFVTVSLAAIGLYLICNRFANRVEAFGGFAPATEWLPNLLKMVRSILTWPKRQFAALWAGAWQDFVSHAPPSQWLLVGAIAMLLAVWVVLVSTVAIKWQGDRNGRARLVWIGLLGGGLVFLPLIPFSFWQAQMRSRIVYIPWTGFSVLLACTINLLMRHLAHSKLFRPVLASLLGLIGLYVCTAVIIHFCIQESFAHSWALQKKISAFVHDRLQAADLSHRFVFVRERRVLPGALDLDVPEGFDFLAYEVSRMFGVRHPELVQVSTVAVRLRRGEREGVYTLALTSRKGSVNLGQIALPAEGKLHGVILFGLKDGEPVLFDRVRVVDVPAGIQKDFFLSSTEKLGGPFEPLVVQYIHPES